MLFPPDDIKGTDLPGSGGILGLPGRDVILPDRHIYPLDPSLFQIIFHNGCGKFVISKMAEEGCCVGMPGIDFLFREGYGGNEIYLGE